MKRSKFSEHQIIAILKAVEAGRTVKDVCREHEVSEATYYQWKSKYGGMEASDLKRMKELEDENNRLKKMYADMALENVRLRICWESYNARPEAMVGGRSGCRCESQQL